MGTKRSIEKHRANRHRHALQRLRERYWPSANHDDVIEIRNAAKAQFLAGFGYSGMDGVTVRVVVSKGAVTAVYIPRHNALATVLIGPVRSATLSNR